ncbi:MAG: 16S rRNA (guanine(966)-N(2))-methyltransferase RsmD [Hyphomicrobiales bacterium]|nr:16S rRNA (guanine(966)-N(2))-methyltransferase RsmD [Hyphomicrobiales bacterium]MBV9519737.1 16S rRNA (guanine(966)-N(2))-methyltransferase RsmD [Hyphomicrobiales bacterium]
MRIVAGRFRGHVLASPSSRAIRPTSDRMRETIFNILAHGHGDPVTGARVLDLFAGTGAMGLEALSRGASFCLFVDQAAEARSLMRASIEKLGCAGQARIFRRDAMRLGAAKPLAPFSLVFCDPPYGRGLAAPALSSALGGGWIAPDATIVVEEASDCAFTFPTGFVETERRTQGDTMIAFAEVIGEADRQSR